MHWPIVVLATQLAAFLCLVVIAASDLHRRIIPNELVLVMMIVGLVLRLLIHPHDLWLSLAIWAGSLVVIGLLAVNRMVGWGDVKLLAAVTLLVPPSEVMWLLLTIVIMGGMLAGLYLALGQLAPRIVPRGAGRGRRFFVFVENGLSRIGARRTLPYGLAVLFGTTYHTAAMAMRCWPVISC